MTGSFWRPDPSSEIPGDPDAAGDRGPSSEVSGDPAGGTAFGGTRPAASTGASSESGPDAHPDVVGEAGPEADTAAPADYGEAPAPEPADPLTETANERDEYRDALIRLQADFENYKKRIIKQQTEHLERAAESLVDKLLPVLDTADLALAHGGGEDVEQVTSALLSTLEREGLERIDPVGGRFDPTLHDAVAHEPGEGGDQEVVEVLRAGYRWKGRVLRPAMVKVRG